MSAVMTEHSYTPEEYLALERAKLQGKAEYLDGQIYDMAGAGRNHNLIAMNIASSLHAQLKGRPCEAYMADMKVRAANAKAYFYPDISVVCGGFEPVDQHQDILTNPSLVIEVLSPSTESFDRGAKFLRYRHIESLQEYYLVSQEQPLIEQYIRQGENWILREIAGLELAFELPAIGCKLALSEIYDRVF